MIKQTILLLVLMIFFSAAINAKENSATHLLSEAESREQVDQLITLNFQNIAVRRVLQLVAEYSDFNLIIADSVVGEVSVRLKDVSWQQALETILKIKRLEKRIEGNVMFIAPAAQSVKIKPRPETPVLTITQPAALQSELIRVHFAKASDIAAIIHGGSSVGMLSPLGSMSVDERTNAMLVRDVDENITKIKAIVKQLDIPVKQVEIEARIVIMNQGNLEELGVRWGLLSTQKNMTVGASLEGNLAAVNGGEHNIDDFLNVNLGVTSANATSIAFQVAKLGSETLLDLELSALQQESKAEIISNPRLITTNKHPAYIEQGTEIPYVESASSGATSVAFKKAVLSLEVTPQITPDNRLVLDLYVTQDRPGTVVKTGTGEAVAIDTQRIGTQVLVDDGETIVLGGIYQHSIIKSVDKVPVLSDLPFVGGLFRRNYENMGKSELLIFVTPKVIM
ncbi:fimbrial protein [Vibrio sp. 10N.286.49.B3]|uniref:type IV pilus secretin PilQ n=1 Tax=Vibrio sp. 10N.286.49.B3 TaxID=1880855 RepID=UPI000C837013|nr:type IV pilus secretin PilQ [Vibrio sp. 10N.286.49.B3]PMH46283.1 fimbrial protein [Vibrio sp. 10N.286.49.B3]